MFFRFGWIMNDSMEYKMCRCTVDEQAKGAADDEVNSMKMFQPNGAHVEVVPHHGWSGFRWSPPRDS